MDTLSQQILERAPTAIICVDRDDRILFANAAAVRLLGSGGAAELLGQPIRTYIQFLSLSPKGEEWCVREDGSSIPIEYETAPMIDADGAIGTVLTLGDVSERRAAARTKDELISIVSHELRTPLTSIRSALGLLASGQVGALSARGENMLSIAVSNSDRLIRLITDLLDLERVGSGKVRMQRVPCAADDLMTQAADSVRGMADAARVVLEVAPTDAVIQGDPDRLQQVLINLLANAIKFSPAEGGTVWLDADVSHDELLLRVRDEGRGIPADKLEAIFERFEQVEEADARKKGGTGLGLAICRAIVKQHGGQIWAESTLGAGTTLCVALPIEEEVEGDLEWAA